MTTAVRSNSRLTDEEKRILEGIRSGELKVAPPKPEPEAPDPDKPADEETRTFNRAFALSPDQVAKVESGRGRHPVDQAYLADVREMVGRPGEYAGFAISTQSPSSVIRSKLQRAAKEAGLQPEQYGIHVREKDGFVSFTVHTSASSSEEG